MEESLKKLVVYYSFEGNTAFIAKAIAEAVGADVLELKPKKEIPRGFLKIFWGAMQVLTKKKPELSPFDRNPDEYDVIFIGTPVWAFTYAPALRSFFTQVQIRNKRVALFCCCGGQKGKTLNKMREELPANDFIGEIDFIEPLRKKEENASRAGEWAKKVIADIT